MAPPTVKEQSTDLLCRISKKSTFLIDNWRRLFEVCAVNYLGIDYGRKRTGLSICHGEIGIVLPIDAIITEDDEKKIDKICEIIRENKITGIAIGYPLNMDGTVGNMAKQVDVFVEKLAIKLPGGVEITRMDERLTSEQASEELQLFHGRQSANRKRKQRRRGSTDSQAAMIILQDFIDKLGFMVDSDRFFT
jgi:putative Holliday junction resolvase